MSAPQEHENNNYEGEDDAFFNADDVAAEVNIDDDDHPMEDADENEDEEMAFQNDSSAHFDKHNDSIFCISQHPVHKSIVMTGGGDDVAYIFDSTPIKPVLPPSYESSPQLKQERESVATLAKLEGHEDSVNGVAFTKPD
ncbi:hypothetical protein KEM55_005066, partial [Ascosphaera atra]